MTPAILAMNAHCETPQQKNSWSKVGGTILIVLAVYLLLKKFGLAVSAPTIAENASLALVFGIGLIAAFSSCTAVVIGLVAAVSSTAAEADPRSTVSRPWRPHILFNLGRVLGFAAFGAIVGWAGSVVALSTSANALLVLAIAILMLILGANLLGIVPPRLAAAIRPPKRISKFVMKLQDSKHPAVPFVLGALTFFLPCGFTQSMQLYALSTGDPLRAALIMATFALGTAPALLSVGVAASSATGAWRHRVTKFAGVLVMVMGLSNAQSAMNLLGWNTVSAATEAAAPQIVNGQQVIQMEVTSSLTYEPSVLRVKAGVPVKWEIYGADRLGCASTLVVPAENVSAYLRPGYNVVTFTPKRLGAQTFTCSMGMTRGTLIVE